MTEQLDLDLSAAASAFDIPEGDVDAVVRRAGQRAGRRRQGLAIATVVGLVAATAGVLQLREGGGERNVAADGGTAASAEFTWKRVDVRSGVGQGFFGTGRPLYALSTSAAERDFEKARINKTVWRSDDGVEWSSVSTLSDDLYLTDLSKRDNRIYAVGTAPATATAGGRPASSFVFGWSDDGAKSWRQSPLPIDVAAISAVSQYVGQVPPKIVSGPKGTVAVANVATELDVPRVLPEGVTAPNGWAITGAGVDLLGPRPENPCPEGTATAPPGGEEKVRLMRDQPQRRINAVWCFRPDGTTVIVPTHEVYDVTRSFTFEELGVRGDALDAVLRRPFVFSAAPGSTDFKRYELPADVVDISSLLLDADEDGFRLSVSSSNPEAATGSNLLLTSSDGRRWSVANRAAGPQAWITAAGRLGSTATMLVSDDRGGAMLQDDGSGGWSRRSFADVLGAAEVGDREAHLVSGGVGEFGVVAVVALMPTKGERMETRELDFRVLASRDGRTWNQQRLETLAGGRVWGVLRVHVTDADATVITSVGDGVKPANTRQVALVATA